VELDVLLLAAGFGRRLHPLTAQLPKALLPVGGVPLIDRHLARLADCRRVVVNTHHLAAQVSAHLAHHPLRARIHISHEPEILGTGGAIAAALAHLRSDPFAVVNCDALFDVPLADCLAWHRARDFRATMILVPAPRWASVLVDADAVCEIRRGQRPAGAFTFTGCHLVSQALARSLPRGVFHDIIATYTALIAQRRLGAFVVTDRRATFLDVGTPSDYLAAHRLLLGADFVRAGYCAPSADIGPGARAPESVVLSGAALAAGARLLRCIVGPGARASGELRDLVITDLGRRAIDDATGGDERGAAEARP